MNAHQAFAAGIDQDLHRELETIISGVSNNVPAQQRQNLNHFVRALYHDVAVVDLMTEPAGQHARRVLDLWEWGQSRSLGAPQIRLSNPPAMGDYWRDEVTFVEIVNDDMPFLVDSISAEFARLGLEVRLLLHPVFWVSRDAEGKLTKLAFAQEDGVFRESWMHITINRQPEDRFGEVQAALLKVFSDVRLAVADWKRMCKQVEEVEQDLPARLPRQTAPADITEAQNFLQWLQDDHFVFLGSRDYTLSSDGTRMEEDVSKASGLLRDGNLVVLRGIRRFEFLPDTVKEFLRSPEFLFINKTQARSTVHRSGFYDIIGIKKYDAEGRFSGLSIFIGLFTSTAYSRKAEDIPFIRRKVEQVLNRSSLDPKGHSGKALTHILNTYPRDDLFQISAEALYIISRGILSLAERQRTTLFVWHDPFDRFVSSLVYVPRDRFDTNLRKKIVQILETAFGGQCISFVPVLSESPLVRLQVIVDLAGHTNPQQVDLVQLEKRLIDAARGWDDTLVDLLVEAKGAERGLKLAENYRDAFTSSYKADNTPVQAAQDVSMIAALEQSGQPLQLRLTQKAAPAANGMVELRLYHAATPLPLSDVLPQLENMGLRILSEVPYQISPLDGQTVWVHHFAAQLRGAEGIDISAREAAFAEAFEQLYIGAIEDDRYNQLVLRLGLDWREVTVLRAYGKYLQQARYHGTPSFIRDTLAAYPAFTQGLVKLFHAQFDPAKQHASSAEAQAELVAELEAQLEKVASVAEDEVLRRYLNLLTSTLRTNYYQTTEEGKAKPYLSFKLDSQKLTNLPAPRPMVEIWVYSPRIEGIHLRGGKVARGGLRWSDRRDDFRTEVLGLVKAQMVKNAVIVPVGSKGGFFCKALPLADKAQEKVEVVACYQTFIRGLLDITDNSISGQVIPPQAVVRRDGDDPYLVVAADKGTATFSDIANALSIEYGFWLGDAFASGGSAGYDHKAMGITARGAWEAIKRHFREMGTDIQTQPFTCVGVGDMSGDVFGNGMLCSQQTRLVAAFNHKHIFIDPTPDAATSYQERKRLFELQGSQWSDYNPALISAGGGVFERSAKSLTISAEAKAALGLTADKMSPNELIQCLLRAPVDLLYLGGIGTYIKASSETHQDASDKANDALRVDAAELKAKVVGEGANLGVTAKARIEYALKGGRINSDAIDNSAGVDTSDHEVNIKIALQSEMQAGRMDMAARNILLKEMTDEVAGLVLRDNYLQTQMLSVEHAQAVSLLEAHQRLIQILEQSGSLNRKVENLPSDEEIADRAARGLGLTRPELATLMAYAKMSLYGALESSPLLDDPALSACLHGYFPQAMQQKLAAAIDNHRLKREIIATVLANDIVNRMGPTFVVALNERSGCAVAGIVRAYQIVAQVFKLEQFWQQVEALDNKVSATTQYELLMTGQRFVTKAVVATVLGLSSNKDEDSITAKVQAWAGLLRPLLDNLSSVLPDTLVAENEARSQALMEAGVPADLAKQAAGLAPLSAGPDIIFIAQMTGVDVAQAAKAYYAVGASLGVSRLQQRLLSYKASNHWQRQEATALADDLARQQLRLTSSVIRLSAGDIAKWREQRQEALARHDKFLGEVTASAQTDLAMLAIAVRGLKAMVD